MLTVTTYAIERNVPISDARRGRPSRYPLAKMRVGDSFSIPKADVPKSGIHGVYVCAKNCHITISIRMHSTGYRIWRIK